MSKNLDIKVILGDITNLGFRVDMIVNAANSGLCGGGGVDGAIHRAGGPSIQEECNTIIKLLGSIPDGCGVVTSPGKLESKYLLHMVGPNVKGALTDVHKKKLEQCYNFILMKALENKSKSVAIPNISTGIYGFPKEQAVDIVIDTILKVIEKHEFSDLEVIYLVCYDEENYGLYMDKLMRVSQSNNNESQDKKSPNIPTKSELQEIVQQLLDGVGIYVDGLFHYGLVVNGKQGKVYTLHDATHCVIIPNTVNKEILKDLLDSEGINTAVHMSSEIAKIVLSDFVDVSRLDDGVCLITVPESLRVTFIRTILMLAPRVLGHKVELQKNIKEKLQFKGEKTMAEVNKGIKVLQEIFGDVLEEVFGAISNIDLGNDLEDLDLEDLEQATLDLEDIDIEGLGIEDVDVPILNLEDYDCGCDCGFDEDNCDYNCACDCDCGFDEDNCDYDCACDCDCGFDEDNCDYDCACDCDCEYVFDEDDCAYCTGCGLEDTLETENQVEKILEIVEDFVYKLQDGEITDFELSLSSDDYSGDIKTTVSFSI